MSTDVKFYTRAHMSVKILQASQLRDIFKANIVTCKTDVYKCGTNKIIFFYNRQKNVTFMHRYQVAKYVIFHSEKIFVKGNFLTNILASKKNFTKIKKFKNFKMRL
jgi:hypothetical protein